MPLQHTVDELVLKNGARGLLVNVPRTTVMSYTFHFRAGNDYAARPEIEQVAHLMEHMAFGPNEQFETMEAFSQEFSLNGAYSNATTWDTNMHYDADCAVMEWERILLLQLLAISKPKFTQTILEAEKGNVREELVGKLSNSPRHMWAKIDRAMGSSTFSDEEKIATISNETLDDIAEHHKRTHTSHNMRFVLAGDFGARKDTVERILEDIQLPAGKRLEPKNDPYHDAALVSIQRNEQKNINFGLTMRLMRKLDIDELITMSVLNHILTGTFHSRVWGKARSLGICYSMGSDTGASLDGTSNWDFYGQVRPENGAELFDLIISQLKLVLNGDISMQELAEAKSYYLGDYQMRGQTVASLAGWYGNDYFFDETIDPLQEAPQRILSVSIEDIIRLAQEFISASSVGFGGIGSVDGVLEPIQEKLMRELFKKPYTK